MQSFVLQDWITVRSAGSADFVQETKDWLGLSSFQDIVLWLDIRRLDPPGATGLVWNFQTAPTKDEALFQTMASQALSGVPTGPLCLPVLLAGGPAVPLATWVRWVIHPQPNAGVPWTTMFRVMASANRLARSRGVAGAWRRG